MLSKPLFNGVRFSSVNLNLAGNLNNKESADSSRRTKSPSGSPTPPPPPLPVAPTTTSTSPLYVTVANSADLGTHV